MFEDENKKDPEEKKDPNEETTNLSQDKIFNNNSEK